MPISPGARLGSYEVLSPLDAGGMGEVYRARDTKLGGPNCFRHSRSVSSNLPLSRHTKGVTIDENNEKSL